MFSQFPILIAPIDHITTVTASLRGTLTATKDSRQITTTGNFIVEAPVGSKLLVTVDGVTTVVGYVGTIISSGVALLEEPSQVTLSGSPATVHQYKSGVVRGKNNYLFPEKAQPILIADFFRRVRVTERYVRDASVLLPYEVLENETPEMVSMKFYGTPLYHWTILLANDILDPRTEWPLSEVQLIQKIYDQYSVPVDGTATIDGISGLMTGVGTTWTADFSPLNQVVVTDKYKVLGTVISVGSNTSAQLSYPPGFSYTGDIRRCDLTQVHEYRNVETGYVEDYDVEKLAQGIISPITIQEYEIEQNEAKRHVKIIRPDFITDFARQFFTALTSAI